MKPHQKPRRHVEHARLEPYDRQEQRRIKEDEIREAVEWNRKMNGEQFMNYCQKCDTVRQTTFCGYYYDGDMAIGDWNGGNPNIMLKTGGNVGIGKGSPSSAGLGNYNKNTGFIDKCYTYNIFGIKVHEKCNSGWVLI